MALDHYIKIWDFTSGERIAILAAIQEIAAGRGLTELVEHIDESLAHERATRALDDRWAARQTGRIYGPRVMDLHDRVVPVLGSIRDIAESHTRALPPGDAMVGRIRAMLGDLFPAGLLAVTSLAYVDQVAATEIIVDKLTSGHAPLVGALGLTRQVAYLAELTAEYRDAVVNDRKLTFAEVKTMRELGQALLRETIAMILGLFPSTRDPAQIAAREALLEPVEHETARARKRRARRRGRTAEADGSEPTDEPPEPTDEGEEPDEARPVAVESVVTSSLPMPLAPTQAHERPPTPRSSTRQFLGERVEARGAVGDEAARVPKIGAVSGAQRSGSNP